MKLRSSSAVQAGPPKQVSQDRVIVRALEDGGLLCVLSDGVGSARDPERCAERVVRLVADHFSARPRDWPIPRVFDHLVRQANESLAREGFYHDGTTSMQATVAVACLLGNRIFGMNAGDSPILLVRGDTTERLSINHSLNEVGGEDRITQAVGMGPSLNPHYFEHDLLAGDTVILTSDGLTKLIDEKALGRMGHRLPSAHVLIQEAVRNHSGTDLDDLSVIIVHVEELGPPERELRPFSSFTFPRPAKGREFDGYTLLTRMSGNDRVWLARKGDRRSVVKFIPQEAETDDSGTLLARFAREIWNSCRLHGEYFIPARPAENGDPGYYLMDYVEAPSLKFFLKSRKLSVEETIELGRFLCHAGQFLLTHELVHGDLKPDNLLVFRTEPGVSFKLLDLGLATTVFTGDSAAGTPSYLAPERFAGAMLTERTEIFSIGATLYESLTGRPPFGRIERFQTPRHRPPVRPSKLNPNVPPWLESVILKCLNLQPEKRYRCYSELLFALNHPEEAPWEIQEGPLLESNPLLFYKVGFWVLLGVVLGMVFYLLRPR